MSSPRARRHVGQSPPRVDGLAKAAGLARFLDDEPLPGALHAAIAYSPVSHGVLEALDTSAAAAVPGVVAILTAADLPPERNQIGVVRADQPLLAHDQLRWRGDRLALIAAESPAAARQAAAAVSCRYRELPVVSGLEAALRPEAAHVHEPAPASGRPAPLPGDAPAPANLADALRIRVGDIEAAQAAAVLTISNRYRAGWQEHAYLEPNAVAAIPQADGGMLVRGSMQCPFYVQKAIARVLGLPLSRVRVQQSVTGGAFGGKEDYPNEPAACAALLAVRTGRPVKLVFRREEDLAYSTKRHRMEIDHTLYADREGGILGMRVTIRVDAGAYLGLSTIVSERANASACGPYRVPNVAVDTQVVYTNNAFGGAFRGFGAPQVSFALERQLDLLAARVGSDPLAIRLKNILRPGDTGPVGERVERDVQAKAALALAGKVSGFATRWRAPHAARRDGHRLRGVGLAAMRYGVGLHAGGQHLEGSGALVQLHADGSVRLTIGGTEMGQGAFTAMALIAAETLGVEYGRLTVGESDTALVPDSGPTVASRTTLMSGNAVADACRQLRQRLLDFAARRLGRPVAALTIDADGLRQRADGERLMSFDDLVAQAFAAKVHLAASGWYAPPRKQWDKQLGRGEAYTTYAHAAMVAEVAVDTLTGRVHVERIHAIHDVGQAIHRAGLHAQVEGGVVQGLGWAVMEELQVERGLVRNPNFSDYLIPSIQDIPEVEVHLIERPYKAGPFGAKGIGEPALIPVAAAIANAVAHALGRPVTELPLTPERVALTLLPRY